MVCYRWKPEENLTGWNSEKTFYEDTWYTGIPYSQTVNQCDDEEFEDALDYSDFYSYYVRNGTVMPKYGCDCSGFVSICWGLSHMGNRLDAAGYYSGYSELPNGYEDLQKGDAVVTSDHIMLVTQNHEEPPDGAIYDESYVAIYEQTPPMAQQTFWTYAQLEDYGYKAISYFY